MHRKFTKLRQAAGEKPVRKGRNLSQICRAGGLSAPRRFDELPAGERRVLATTGTEAFARRVGEAEQT